MSLRHKLNRLKTHMAPEPKQQSVSSRAISDPAYDKKWRSYGAKVGSFEGQSCVIREVSFPLDTRWGRYAFRDLPQVVARWGDYKHTHPLSSKGLDSGDLLFFDTETTGISSGAGNTIFLLGMGRVLADRVVVKQFFLPHPGAEAALYYHFLTNAADLSNLVTYNGKAFDWPQVKTRHTFVRDRVPSLPAFGHFDLLHAARRLWKHHLPSLRLSVVEERLLAIHRQQDTPGQMAPILYFDYLKSQNPEAIFPVLQHNERDVLSLMTLYTHLSTLLLEKHDEHLTPAEHYEVGRWFEAVGEVERATRSYDHAIQATTITGYRAQKALARLYKKQAQWDRAERLWKACCEGHRLSDYEPYIELAKMYEHQHKQFDEALFYAEKGYGVWQQTKRLIPHRKRGREREAFKKRIARLEKKCIHQLPRLF